MIGVAIKARGNPMGNPTKKALNQKCKKLETSPTLTRVIKNDIKNVITRPIKIPNSNE